MGDSERTYLVRCVVGGARRDRVPELRPAHLEHIAAHRERIQFGGVVVDGPGRPPTEVVLVVRASSPREVAAMAAADPYADVYDSVHISEFETRIPRPAE